MPATKGRRNPALLEAPLPPLPSAPTAVREFYCGKKPLTYLGDRYSPGERMPDSVGSMTRLDTRVSLGLIHVSYVMPPAPAAEPAAIVPVDDDTVPPVDAAPVEPQA